MNEARGQRKDLQKTDLLMKPTVYVADDLEIIEGLEVINLSPYNQRRFLQLEKDAKTGSAQRFFFGETARYDIGIDYTGIEGFSDKLLVKVMINDNNVGEMQLDIPKGSSDIAGKRLLSEINIQRYSKITLEFTQKDYNGGKFGIEKLILTPAGSFMGQLAELKKPETLRIYESKQEEQNARGMLNRFVVGNLKAVTEKRNAELASLKTPEDWKERQRRTRSHLHEYFGEFPRKTPLNAKIVGKLDREKYVIEKLIFESQPKYYCTANFYVPKGREFPQPGVLFTCGHSDGGKGEKLYHETALGLVLKGYVVLALDPMGQGERSEYFDPVTLEPLVDLCVPQHHYVGRPAFLVDWTLSGLRTWDCIRAVDYLVSRPEVDKDKLAAVGNSGGGQMAVLITAVDERIKVCASAHPGGSMENTYLKGQRLGENDKEVLSLIPPRPCRIIVGKESGEVPGHFRKLEDMHLFYEGLGVGKHLGDMEIVDGVHDMRQPKRESAYEWLNRWFGKEVEGREEQSLQPEETETLWCTNSGITLVSLGGETGQKLNAKRAENIYKPERNIVKFKERVAKRIGFTMPQRREVPPLQPRGTFISEDFTADKLLYESEEAIEVPALLLKPKNPKLGMPIIIHASDKGKPTSMDISSLPMAMVRDGYTVFSIDVRGVGETDSSPPLNLTKYTGYISQQWRRDCLAIQSASFKRTMLGMRALDVVCAIDFIKSRDDLRNKQIVFVGEGLGGLWMLLAAVYDHRASAVVCAGTLPSYKLILNSKYYFAWGYFWVPGALRDYDIPDLARLVTPRQQLWVDPVDALAKPLDIDRAYSVIGDHEGIRIVNTDSGSAADVSLAIAKFLIQMNYRESQ
ncbi:alpha/beta hydrolase family protein [candidate division KSB1 bacterium]